MKIKIDKKRIILKTAIYVCAALVLAAAYRSGGSLPGNDRAAEELPKPAESLVKVENEEIRQMPKNADTAAKSEKAAENKPTSEEGGQQKSCRKFGKRSGQQDGRTAHGGRKRL